MSILPIMVVGAIKASGLATVGGVDLTIVSLSLLLSVVASRLFRYPYPLLAMLPFALVALIALVAYLATPPGVYSDEKAMGFFLIAVPVALSIPVLVRTWADVRGMLAVWYVGGMLLSTLVLTIGADESVHGRSGLGGTTLAPAYFAASALVLGIIGMANGWVSSPIALPGLILSGVTLVTIGSRGPLIASIVALAMWIPLSGRFSMRLCLGILGIGAGTYLGLRLASDVAKARVVFEDETRIGLWIDARLAFYDHPLFGVGWGRFAEANFTGYLYPHNVFLEAAAEMGAIGIVAISLLLCSCAIQIIRFRRVPEASALAAVAAVWTAGQLFSGDYTNRVFWLAVIPCLILGEIVGNDKASRSAATPGRRSHGSQGRAPLSRDPALARPSLRSGISLT